MNNKESSKPNKLKSLDMSDIEMVFGSPASPRGRVQPDVHIVMNEKNGKNVHKNAESDTETVATQPLLEPDKGKPKPPLAGPEIDDLDGDQPTHTTPYPGIDDGLLEPNNNKPDVHEGNSDGETKPEGSVTHSLDDPTLPRDDHGTEDDFNNGLEPRFGIDDRPMSPTLPGSIPDVNTYQQKKNLAQGMMDLALLSANANQLRYVLESSTTHPYYYPSVALISLSIIFQVAVGIGLILNSRYNVKDDKHMCIADKINNMTVLGIFLITIVNVFITSFSVATPTTVANQQAAIILQAQSQG
ncbi:unnamed protein product, partial [Brenthis ino]